MDAKLLNPLTLAYMGDAVLDQHVREYIVLKLQSKTESLTPSIETICVCKKPSTNARGINNKRMVY